MKITVAKYLANELNSLGIECFRTPRRLQYLSYSTSSDNIDTIIQSLKNLIDKYAK